jgi:hypothetical protein
MKSNLYTKFAVLIMVLVVSVGAVFADVKIKSRQKLSQKQNDVQVTGSTNKEGTIRIGLAGVKIGAVGEGINAQELAGAIQNTLGEYLKGSRIEIVPLEAKLASAVSDEAREKQCDFILNATVSHKKGGSGFGGMLKAVAPMMGNIIPMAGGAGGAIAGSIASTVITTAAGATANVKPKDEITLDISINPAGGGAAILTKQFKTKAKSGGEDIISPMIEQAAQAILDAVAK